MAESDPEIVYLLALLADERCGPGRGLSLLQTLAKFLLLGRQRHSHQPRGGGLVQWNYPALRRWSATLHFADDPMQQAGTNHFVLAKLCRDVFQ
jgi:hypothetical protein